MTAAPNRYALLPVRSPQEWAAYHAIRRQANFRCPPARPSLRWARPRRDRARQLSPRAAARRRNRRRGSLGRAKRAFAWWASGAISSGNATAASCSGSQKTPRAFSAERRSSSTPTRPFYLAYGYRQGEWDDAGPLPATLIRVGKRLPC